LTYFKIYDIIIIQKGKEEKKMSYYGYVVKVEHLRPHSNADRLQVATFFGNDTIVSLDTQLGAMGIYFPTDGQLSERYCAVNDLVRRKDENGNYCGGYLDPDKRNIKAIKLRGEKSDGLFMPITSLADFCTISDLKVGDRIDVLNGEEICRKYIPHSNASARAHGAKAPRKAKANIAPTFYEHVDTEQLAYNLDKFKVGDTVQLTLKMHGTSGRTGYLPLLHTKRTLIDKIFRRHGKDYYEYGYITGTRRVVLDGARTGGFYESDDFRHAMAAKFEGKLRKGEVAYYEIVGFQGYEGAPIMSEVQNSKVKDPEFSKQYGKTTVFSYGCSAEGGYTDDQPCCEVYVYRMTMVNADGDVVEYSPAQIKERCEQMGVHTVMEFETFVIPENVNAGEYVLRKVEQYFDGADPIGKTHVREGVVARILNRPNFAVYKHKNFSFKVLEGIAKDEATAPDIEEAQEVVENVD
jgi:hypothetical protein